MRVKQLFSRVPVPDKVKLVYARLTLNKLTTLYFIVAIVHFVLQVVLQLAAHAINVNARHLVTHILEQAKLTMDKFALVETKRRSPQARESDLTLTLCRGIPGQFGLTGKDVCNALWTQSRGLVNDTVEDFLSPSSESDGKESDSDSDDEKKSTPIPQLASTSSIVSSTKTTSSLTLTATPSALPVAVVPITSSASSASFTTTSIKSPASSSFSTASTPSSSVSRATSSSISQTSGLVAPTGVANLIKPDSGSSDSHSESNSDDDEGGLVSVLARRRTAGQKRSLKEKKAVAGEKKVFNREKIRPLSLPPRPRTPSPTETKVDIDETHPNPRAHSRRAHVAPMTSSLLARAREGLTVMFVPIAPRQAADPKRFVSSRSKRGSVKPRRPRSVSRRALSAQDQLDVTVTPIFEVKAESDDEKKGSVVGQNTATGTKSKLVAVKVSGLLGPGLGEPSHVNSTTGTLAGGTTGLAATFGEVELSPGCALALAWPGQVLRDFAREDLAMIGFQAWLLGVSIVAILNESVPHLAAGLFTQALSTGWSAFQMARSSSFKTKYETAIVRGACAGVDILPDYFAHRTKDEIPIVVLNGIFLVATAVISWRMCRVYGWQTFKRIGASQVMNQAYRLVLALSIHLQLAVFFFVVSSAMWVDELLNGPVACFAQHRTIYEGIFITSVLLLLPWLVLGWIGVRRENKHMMHAFLLISLFYVTAWAAMFASDVYRWTFATWPFFAAMTVVSYIVVVATTGLAVVCRYNFKKGLALFLQSQQTLPEADFSSAMPDPEKVEFPTHRSGQSELPTFSVAFGQGGRPQPPAQMFSSRSVLAAMPPRAQSPSVDEARAEPPVGYSVNPYAASSDFWGERNPVARSESVRSKRSADGNGQDTFREAVDDGVPRYSIHDDGPFSDAHSQSRSQQSQAQSQESQSWGRNQRELPQWEEVRRSQVPHLSQLNLHPQPQPQPQPQTYLQVQPQADRTSIYSSATGTTTGTGQYEVLRNGVWERVDAHELYRTSVGGMTHASGFSGASWVPGDDAHLPSAPPPVPSMPVAPGPFVSSMPMATRPPAAASRAFVGLPGKNVKPQTSTGGRVTQQFSPPRAGVLGGSAVPQGW